MKLNVQPIKAFQFLQRFKLNIWHKFDKKHIIFNALNHLANTNVSYMNFFYSELNILFTYNITFIEIYPILISTNLASYKADKYWARVSCQIQANKDLGNNKTLFPFISGYFYILNADFHMLFYPKGLIRL